MNKRKKEDIQNEEELTININKIKKEGKEI